MAPTTEKAAKAETAKDEDDDDEEDLRTAEARVNSLERQLAELSRERREEMSKRDAEIADLKAKASAYASGSPPGGRTSGPGLSQPITGTYYLQKKRTKIGPTGTPVLLWDTIDGSQSQEPMKSVPDWLAFKFGAGSWRCVDGYGNQVHSVMTVQGQDPDELSTMQAAGQAALPPGSSPAQPSMQQPAYPPAMGGQVFTTPAGYQVIVPTAMDRALRLLDEARMRRDPSLERIALEGIGKAVDGGNTSGDAALSMALESLRKRKELETQALDALGIKQQPTTVSPQGVVVNMGGGMSGPGVPMSWPSDPSAQQSMVDLMAQREAGAATQQMLGVVAEQAGKVLERLADRLSAPKPDQAAVASAGARLAGMQPGAVPQLQAAGPAVTTYAPPASGQRPAAAMPAQLPAATTPPRAPPRPVQQTPVGPPPGPGGGPRVPGSRGVSGQDGNSNSYVKCADCMEGFILTEYIEHLEAAQCPAAPGYQQRPNGPPARQKGTAFQPPSPGKPKGVPAAPATPAPAPAAPATQPAAQPEVPTLPAATAPAPAPATDPSAGYTGLPVGLRKYLEYMASLTGYIQSFGNGNGEHSPESIGNLVWTGVSLPAMTTEKTALVELVSGGGFDKIFEAAKPFVDGIMSYPASLSTEQAKREEQFTALVDALTAAKLIDPAKVQTADDLSAPVELLKGHILIQTEGAGKTWIRRFLNQLARRAEVPLPHPEVLPAAAEQDTL